MHSILVTNSIVLLLMLECAGLGLSGLSFGSLAVGVAIAVALIGVPHGGLDHVVGRDLIGYRSLSGTLAFLLMYMMVSATVVAGWYLLPRLTILVFFCLSAWHFGLEEDDRKHHSALQWAGLIARGGMVIWVPAMFQGPEVAALLNLVLPQADLNLANHVVGIIQVVGPLLIVLTVVDLFGFELWTSGEQHQATADRAATWQHRLRVISFFALFAVANPILSFGIYFCGWHSIRGLIHLHDQVGGSARSLGLQLLPISIAAIVLFAGGFYFWSTIDDVTPAVVRTIFIGLSAVAVPHLLLHVISDLSRSAGDDSRSQLVHRTSPGVAP